MRHYTTALKRSGAIDAVVVRGVKTSDLMVLHGKEQFKLLDAPTLERTCPGVNK